jgi:hypothetical protein
MSDLRHRPVLLGSSHAERRSQGRLCRTSATAPCCLAPLTLNGAVKADYVGPPPPPRAAAVLDIKDYARRREAYFALQRAMDHRPISLRTQGTGCEKTGLYKLPVARRGGLLFTRLFCCLLIKDVEELGPWSALMSMVVETFKVAAEHCPRSRAGGG